MQSWSTVSRLGTWTEWVKLLNVSWWILFFFLKAPPFCLCRRRAADGAPPAEGRHAAAGRRRLHAAASRRAGRQQRDPQVPHRQRWETHPDARSLHFDSEQVVLIAEIRWEFYNSIIVCFKTSLTELPPSVSVNMKSNFYNLLNPIHNRNTSVLTARTLESVSDGNACRVFPFDSIGWFVSLPSFSSSVSQNYSTHISSLLRHTLAWVRCTTSSAVDDVCLNSIQVRPDNNKWTKKLSLNLLKVTSSA